MSRKKHYTGSPTTVRLTKSHRRALFRLAKERECSVSELVARMIRTAVALNEGIATLYVTDQARAMEIEAM